MRKTELIVEGGDGLLFDSLEEAQAVGREMHRLGRNVHIEVMPDSLPGMIAGWRYESDSDEWFMVPLTFGNAG